MNEIQQKQISNIIFSIKRLKISIINIKKQANYFQMKIIKDKNYNFIKFTLK